MSKEEEFFRIEYIEGLDFDGDPYVQPVVWFGVQGFNLIKQYGNGNIIAKKQAKWYVSMFKIAIDNYHKSKIKQENLRAHLTINCRRCGQENEITYDGKTTIIED